MITEFLNAYSHFCSKILRIWQKIAIEYRSYKGLTLNTLANSCHPLTCSLNIVLIKD